jgi:hypothetical protein
MKIHLHLLICGLALLALQPQPPDKPVTTTSTAPTSSSATTSTSNSTSAATSTPATPPPTPSTSKDCRTIAGPKKDAGAKKEAEPVAWFVLIATFGDYTNYRFEADVLATFKTLEEAGVPENRMVVLT